MSSRRFAAIALVLATSPAILAHDTATLIKKNAARAQQVIDAAAQAMGGAEAIQALETVTFKGSGTFSPRMQMPLADGANHPGTFVEATWIDLAKNRVHAEFDTDAAGFAGRNRVIMANGEAKNYDLRSKFVTTVPAAQLNTPQFGQYQRRLPTLIVRNALNNPNTIRYLGEDIVKGRKHDVLTMLQADGTQLGLYFDQGTHLLTKYEVMYSDPLTGREVSEIYFDDYAKVGALLTPRKFKQVQGGDVVNDRSLEVAYNEKYDDESFSLSEAGFTQVPAQTQPEIKTVKLGDGVWSIQGFNQGNYNAFIVEFKDYLLAFDAPISTQLSEQIIARMKKEVPNKPIRYVAMTHFHSDHSGGVRAFINEGATVITTPGNVKIFQQYAAADQPDALAKSKKQASIEAIAGKKRVISDGQQTVELYDIGPNPHTKEMVIAYLPKQRIILQGDMFGAPLNGAPIGAMQETFTAFGKKVDEMGLKVDQIAGVHGRTVSFHEWAAALRGEEGKAVAAGN